MLSVIDRESADYVKLLGFFLFYEMNGRFAYLDLSITIRPAICGNLWLDSEATNRDTELGYGFTYVFKKEVWEAIKLPEWDLNSKSRYQNLRKNHNEDYYFAKEADERFKLKAFLDTKGLCLHTLHNGSNQTSVCYPTGIIPEVLELREKFFPEFRPITVS